MHGEGGGYAYGFWLVVITNVLIFLFFTSSFLVPKKKIEWRNFKMIAAFFVALFTEMYGFPLTIFILTSWLKDSYPALNPFSHAYGHLWLTFFGGGPAMMNWIHIISNSLIFAGLLVMGYGWRLIYQGKGELVTEGLYAYIRHPQYLGLYLILAGFIIQWPTIITVAMFPVLIFMYYRLSLNEEKTLEKEFGQKFLEYKSRTKMFVPFIF